MPRFQLRTPDGQPFVLHSSDREIIGKWFVETLGRFVGYYEDRGEMFTLEIWPLFVPDPAAPLKLRADWCQDTRHEWCHHIDFDGTMRGIIETLNMVIEESPQYTIPEGHP